MIQKKRLVRIIVPSLVASRAEGAVVPRTKLTKGQHLYREKGSHCRANDHKRGVFQQLRQLAAPADVDPDVQKDGRQPDTGAVIVAPQKNQARRRAHGNRLQQRSYLVTDRYFIAYPREKQAEEHKHDRCCPAQKTRRVSGFQRSSQGGGDFLFPGQKIFVEAGAHKHHAQHRRAQNPCLFSVFQNHSAQHQHNECQ